LQQDIHHRASIIDGPPQPVFPTTNLDAQPVQKPPRTPSGFSVTSLLGEAWCERDVPLPQPFGPHLNAALVQSFLDIALAERRSVFQPEGVLDTAQRETVVVGLGVSHERSAYDS